MVAKAKARRGKAPVGRPAQIGLTRDRIVDAAIALIDEKGLAGFSMRELSRALGVYPATIYWHVGNAKEYLFAEIAAAITSNLMTVDEMHADWRETLRILFHRYRDAVGKHPNVAQLLGAELKSNGPPNAPMVEIVLRTLKQAGYSGQPLVDAFNAVIGGLAGYVTMEFGPAPPDGEGEWAQIMSERLDALDVEAFPAIAEYMPLMRNKSFVLRWQNGSSVPLTGGYDCLIESLIAGLEHRSPKRMSGDR
ncbi:MAG: TetR family transcriptional regulator [Pseudolabrys sp.]